jgi:hypothetical protein
MIVVSENKVVFSEVERMLHALYDGDKAYDDSVVVLGYNVAKYLPMHLRKRYPGKKIIVYQLEQMFDSSKWAWGNAPRTPQQAHSANWLVNADEIWEYDLSNMEWMVRHRFKPVYRPMVFCDALKDIEPKDKDIDILFYGFPTPRRMSILGGLMANTWNSYSTVWATGVSGDKLKDMIARSKVILNVHSFVDGCRQEQVRMFYPVINGACVISERSPHNEFGKAIVECSANKLVGTVQHVLDNGLWKDVGMNAPEVYRKHCEERKK